ncbi:acyl carrier protein [Desulfonatronospira sp.]|uniref:acyl carrier protein n=1 Tax=Desulfonatronospira sp. TaxID=1962951 RepID=UPI0025BF2ADF|nr:acyl carrier protein [Desulfonatronospira sp.]
MNNSHQKIRNYIVDNFLFGDDQGLDNDTSFLENGIIDSTGILELVAFLEQEMKIEIADEELLPENLDSINRIVGFISQKANSTAPLTDS